MFVKGILSSGQFFFLVSCFSALTPLREHFKIVAFRADLH